MGRHTRNGPPDDEPVPGASRGPYYGAPADPSYDIFSGPTDDRVFVSSYERPRSGPPPAAERQHGPPGGGYRFDPLPGDYPGDCPGAPAPESPRARPKTRTAPADGRSWTKFISMLPLPLLPIVALVIAVGIVSYALSTQQIALNFAGGGAPRDTVTNPRDSQVSQRGPGERAGRGAARADGLVIAFRAVAETPGGFKATATNANEGAQPVTGWALAFKIKGASVTAISGATAVRTGSVPFVRSREAIAPGAKVRIVFTARGTAAKPSSCVLNKLPCALV
jgi:hypothetical protein